MTIQLAAVTNDIHAQTITGNDLEKLSALNARFIQNFINQDTAAHNQIIHPDFVCINSDGTIADRNTYMLGWSNAYEKSGYKAFTYTDEHIRLFGNMALVRSRTVYTKMKDGKLIQGNSMYTDTYIKENGEWLCVQAQITPLPH